MKKLKTLFIFIVCILGSYNIKVSAQTKLGTKSVDETIKKDTDKIFAKLVAIRHKLHQYPELAGKEKLTQETIKHYLLDLGLQVNTGIYGYGLVGILKGAKKGKNIAWRADMDALPNDFEDKVHFASKIKGVQHGCGHDVHMAIALGIAEVLSKNKKKLKGTVYFIFQPEEESFKGGKGMAESRLFKEMNLKEIYGLHITPFSVGQIMVKPNEMYAYQKGLKIQFKKEVSNETVKSLMTKIGNTIIRSINNSKPWVIQHVLDPKEGLTSPSTIFKDYSFMESNYFSHIKNDTLNILVDLYETEKNKLNNILPTIKKVIENEGLINEMITLSFFKENPTIQNDPYLTTKAINFLDDTYGKGTTTLDYGQIPFSNDDFSYFQEKVPGVYFFLGGSNFAEGKIAMIHAQNFMVDEECIRIGVERFSTLIMERAKLP